jgi:hypothetical protein
MVGSLTLARRITDLPSGLLSVGLVLSFSAGGLAISPGAPLGHKRIGSDMFLFCAESMDGVIKKISFIICSTVFLFMIYLI